ncbi:MAG: DUF1853 family protein [Thiotrichaceae bacterium]|nr:DUF1853 family protein [Thiotrichaceae bacterium]
MNFKHRCINDLAWVIQSPPVISGNINGSHWLNKADCEAEYEACFDALLQLDQHPEPLLNALSHLKPYIIGKRFECFVQFWLEISPNFELLDSNVVLQGKTQTLGEADFFIREVATDKIIHLEVSVKFYLGVDDLSQMQHWYGTNLKDRLDIKFNRLANHQTQLAKKYPELMPFPVDESWCLLKGRMFYPHNQQYTQAFFADNCPQGLWLIAEDKSYQKCFLALDKSQWLSEISQYQGKRQVAPSKIEHSVCMAEIQNKKEVARYFFLPEGFWAKNRHPSSLIDTLPLLVR